MRWALAVLTLVSPALAGKVFFADELRSKALVPTVELSATMLTDIQAWATIEDVKSAGKDALIIARDPKEPSLIYLTNKAGAKGETDLILKIAGYRYRFRLLLGTKTLPEGVMIYESRFASGGPKPEAPAELAGAASLPTQPITPNPTPSTASNPNFLAAASAQGPVEAPPLPTVSANAPTPQTPAQPLYFGFSLAYPPVPVSGTFGFANLTYGGLVGIRNLLGSIGLRAYLGYAPAPRQFIAEGYLVKPLAPEMPFNPYLGLGGGLTFSGQAFVGGLVGLEYGQGIMPFFELLPRYQGGDFSVGARFGLKFDL